MSALLKFLPQNSTQYSNTHHERNTGYVLYFTLGYVYNLCLINFTVGPTVKAFPEEGYV